jgi:hypothetical protein
MAKCHCSWLFVFPDCLSKAILCRNSFFYLHLYLTSNIKKTPGKKYRRFNVLCICVADLMNGQSPRALPCETEAEGSAPAQAVDIAKEIPHGTSVKAYQ